VCSKHPSILLSHPQSCIPSLHPETGGGTVRKHRYSRRTLFFSAQFVHECLLSSPTRHVAALGRDLAETIACSWWRIVGLGCTLILRWMGMRDKVVSRGVRVLILGIGVLAWVRIAVVVWLGVVADERGHWKTR
jgi:hypothetical protein